MNTSSSGAQLTALTKELLARWRQTREFWMDNKGREFEERFMLELESTVKSTINNIDHLDRVLRKIKSDCE